MEPLIASRTAAELESLEKEGALRASDALIYALHSLQRSGEEAENAIIEAGRLRRFMDDGGRQIDQLQARTRASIEDLING